MLARFRDASLFTDNTLARNDDSFVGPVGLGFSINFFGVTRSTTFVNNNGNITLDAGLFTYTPFSLTSTAQQIIAPFFADVDTRNTASGLVQYGTDVIGGRNVFGVNWINVGYFPSAADKLNSFQLILTDRSDIAAGDFDFEFNFDSITWETGGASGGVGWTGRFFGPIGWSNGSTADLELAGSAVNGAFLNGGPNALVSGSLNSGVAGRYIFNVRNGEVQPPAGVRSRCRLPWWLWRLAAAGVASRRKLAA